MKKAKVTPTITDSIYILPNLFTTGNLFFGYFSIINSMQGDYTTAAVAILLAGIFDILDGSIARLAKASSAFGIQYDSLCDLVSFGLAPVILMYQHSLHSYGRIALAICFVYLACGALRLARFNVIAAEEKTNLFIGLPIPIPAALVAAFVAFLESLKDFDISGEPWFLKPIYNLLNNPSFVAYFFLIMSLFLAFFMVSNILYKSHKSVDLTGLSSFRFSVVVVLLLGLVLYRPALMGCFLFFLYILTGPFEYIMGWQEAWNEDEM